MRSARAAALVALLAVTSCIRTIEGGESDGSTDGDGAAEVDAVNGDSAASDSIDAADSAADSASGDADDGPVYIFVEAEDGELTAPFVVRSDDGASGGEYLFDDAGGSGMTTDGAASYTITIQRGGTYYFWGRARAFGTDTDSFFVAVGKIKRALHTGGEPLGDWHWALWDYEESSGEIKPLDLELAAGALEIVISSRESQSALDRFLLTNDLSFVPTD